MKYHDTRHTMRGRDYGPSYVNTHWATYKRPSAHFPREDGDLYSDISTEDGWYKHLYIRVRSMRQ